jgi:hypothetical protein
MTIRKLKLDPEAMQVQSFTPESLPAGRGTAYGYSGAYGPACVSQWPNCNDVDDPSNYCVRAGPPQPDRG